MSREPIGRAAILLLLVAFIAIVLALALATMKRAHAIKKSDRPDCLPSSAVASCSIAVGSSDAAGFVGIRAHRKHEPAAAGQELATILFRLPRADEPKCEVRPSFDGTEMPAVTLRAASGGVTLVLRDDVRLPAAMRWYYSCR